MEFYHVTIPIPKRPWNWIRFRIATLLLLVAIVSILLAWRRDHRNLTGEIKRLSNRSLSYEPAQATGPPNAASQGDSGLAWCPATMDQGNEWLLLKYDKAIVPTAILVHENYAPGAVVRVTHFPIYGNEVTLWEGAYTPTPTTAGSMARLPVATSVKTSRIKVYLDTAAASGWNEVDAVGIEYGKGGIIWASDAEASSMWPSPSPVLQTNLNLGNNWSTPGFN